MQTKQIQHHAIQKPTSRYAGFLLPLLLCAQSCDLPQNPHRKVFRCRVSSDRSFQSYFFGRLIYFLRALSFFSQFRLIQFAIARHFRPKFFEAHLDIVFPRIQDANETSAPRLCCNQFRTTGLIFSLRSPGKP